MLSAFPIENIDKDLFVKLFDFGLILYFRVLQSIEEKESWLF